MTDIAPPAPVRALTCASPRSARRTSRTAFLAEPPDPDDPLLAFEPYIHKAPRRNSITPERQRAFIAALAATGIVTQAARSIGASLEALYSLRNRKGAEGFAGAWEAALDRGMARLEDCALERAIRGEERVIVSKHGEVIARWTRYDTSLITFLLRQRRSERYAASLHFPNLRPGNPVYDRLKREWEQQRAMEEPDIEEVRAEILRKVAIMRRRAVENGEVLPFPNDPEELELARLGEERRRELAAQGRAFAGD